MKKVLISLCALLLWAPMVFGDDVDERLGNQATEQLRNSTRQMIHSGIENDAAIKMTQLMLEHNFRQELMLRAHEIIMDANKKGLPTGPLMSKVNEGLAKQIQAQNIVRAMERVRSRYEFAFEQANVMAQERSQIQLMGNAIAQGLAAGMNEADMKGIMNTIQQRAQHMTRDQRAELAAETFSAVRDMARLGLSSRETAEFVCQALQHEYTAQEMKTLRNSFMAQSRHTDPADLARSYSHAIKEGKGAKDLGSSGTGGAGTSGGHGGPGGSGGSGGHGGSGGGRR